MKRAAKAGIVVAGVVAVGLAGAITLNATQTSSNSIAGAAPSATVSAAVSAPGATKTPSATPSAIASAPAANASASAAPSSQAPVPAPATSAKPDAPVASVPAPAAPAPAPAAPAPVAPAPVASGLDAAGIQRIKDSCTARLQSDAAHSGIVTGTVVPRPFTIVSIAFSGNPIQSTAASGLASYDILMKITTKLVDGPAQDGVRVCRVYVSDSHVDWLPAG